MPTPAPALNTGTSIVDFLKSTGAASDFNSRLALATKNGIQGYSGTEEQNNQLLKLMQPAPVAAAPAGVPAQGPLTDAQVAEKNQLADTHNAGYQQPVAAGSPAGQSQAPAPAQAPVADPNAAPAAQIPPAPAPAPTATPAAPQGTQPQAPIATDPMAPVYQYGNKGPAISAIQSLLGVNPTGNFLGETRAAVKAFQAANGLVVDGIVDAKTAEAINRIKGAGAPGDSSVNSGMNSNKGTTPAATTDIKTGNPQVDALIKQLNNQSPQKSFSDTYKEVYNSLGVPDMKTSYEKMTKDFDELQNKKNDEMQEINNNPWFSEGVRINKLKQLDAKYEGKETILTNKLKLTETQIANARSDAQFVAGKVMDQLDQAEKMDQAIILKAIDIAEKQSEAEGKLTEVSPGATLYNPKTGKSVFTAPSKPASGTVSTAEATKVGSSKLEKNRGTDGFVDPYVYKEAYDGWVNGYVDANGVTQPAIGTAADFVSKFPPAKYVNPQASSIKNLLPEFLQNKASRDL